MPKDIDDIADIRTRGLQSSGEQFHESFLIRRPKPEWPPYIDESAVDIVSGIQIGETDLARENFGYELGQYYRKGLEQSSSQYTDLPDVLENRVDDRDIGLLAFQLNELQHQITDADTGLTDVQHAAEAVIEKLLTRHAGSELPPSFGLDGSSISHVVTQLFQNQTVAENIDLLLEEFDNAAGRGLLSLIDEPQMMTPLWDHQRSALSAWQDANYRGYVDMATATGKTVLGLGAIALRYGELHPADHDLPSKRLQADSEQKAEVLIVAHNDLILEQWRREFDRHLNIPQERTMGSDDISLTWGRIHFRTPQSLVNADWVNFNLVLLDEAHHYATGPNWGSLLERFDSDILAMSGSVDDAGADSERMRERLTNAVGPRLKRYTIREARSDGIIPSFDWEIRYAPFGDDVADLEKLTRRCEQAYEIFRSRLDSGELNIDTDRRLQTYDDIRRFSHTTAGKELKQKDEDFRNLVTRLFSRRTKLWNLSPAMDVIVDLVQEHSTTEKVVILTDSNAQVEELFNRLTGTLPHSDSVYKVSKSQDRSVQQETIDKFDEAGHSTVLVGTGDLLGEGVDMQHASVAINMATGGVNQQLVQRIGRVLRNPQEGHKHAMFYNLVGVPHIPNAAVFREDGKQLIENAASFCGLGARFDKIPGFAAADGFDERVGVHLFRKGAEFIDSLDKQNNYDWGADRDGEVEPHLRALHEISSNQRGDLDTILGGWEEYGIENSKPTEKPTTQSEQEAGRTEGSETIRRLTAAFESQWRESANYVNIDIGDRTMVQYIYDEEHEGGVLINLFYWSEEEYDQVKEVGSGLARWDIDETVEGVDGGAITLRRAIEKPADWTFERDAEVVGSILSEVQNRTSVEIDRIDVINALSNA